MRSKRLALAFAAAVLFAPAIPGQAAGASKPPRPGGGDSLQRLRAADRRAESSRAAPREVALIFVALAAGSLLIVVIGAIQAKRPLRLDRVGQSPEGGAHMRRKSNDRKLEREAQDGAQPDVPFESASETAEGDEDRQRDAFAELGEHVASVLETAREAAERIEADARRESTLLLERSEVEAARMLAVAREKAREVDAETARARAEADGIAEEIRTRADAYADEKRQEADEAATELVARAERQARERARAAEERQHALDVNVERTEERLRKLVTGLRELAGRLDVLVGSDGLADLVGPGDEARPPALDEALKRQAAEAEPTGTVPSMAERSGQEA